MIAVLAYDGVKLLDVAGPVEVFAEANRLGTDYEVRVVSVDGADVTSSSGVVLRSTSDVDSALRGPIDTAVIAGADRLTRQPIGEELVKAAGDLAAAARRTCSICTGAFILAKAGLLENRRATTHWRAAPLLARSYPDIAVDVDSIFVQDGDVFTSAGVTAGIDLALALVERDHGPRLAREVAQLLVVFMQRPGGQSQFSPALDVPRSSAPGLQDLVDAVVANPAGDHSAEAMSARVAVSPRHLRRMFHDELATTPARFVESVRIDAAKRILLDGGTVTLAAREAGFGSAESLRRAFGARVGVSPSAYRDRFQTTQP
ncbi:MAG TPA: DJ-1/PfpI family protein [Marmoricola sp.]|nr:DJ-1/PfpI family protein [Marmoricola sp.]